MAAFRNISIRWKLVLIITVTAGVALVPAGVAFFIYEMVMMQRVVRQDLMTMADVIGANSASALDFKDDQAARQTLAALRLRGNVVAAALYDKQQKLFAWYTAHKFSGKAPEFPGDDGPHSDGGMLGVFQPIIHDNQRVGTIYVLADMEEVYSRLKASALIVAGVVFLSSLAAFALSSRLQRLISNPIQQLARMARRISENKDYSERAEKAGEDEVGQLIDGINGMLAQIQHRDSALQGAHDELQAANRAKDEFLATLSHELRTPLTPMLAWTRMLRGGKLDAAGMARGLEVIDRNVHVQAKLIEDLLDVSRIITGKLRLNVRPIKLLPVIEAAIEAVKPAAEAKSIALERAFDAPDAAIAGDAERMQQVVWNLLSNAIRYTPMNGRVTIQLQRAESEIQVVVSDTGEGISPDFLPYVFDRFRQADSSISRQQGGLGLGLAIVRHLAELHGGTVAASSAGRGKGAAFTLRFPALRSAAAATDILKVPPPEPKGPILKGLRVLVLDDEADTRELLTVLLTGCGALVTTASSAEQAMAEIQRGAHQLLISDLAMPGEDGLTFIRKVRKLAPPLGAIPAVALTAYARQEDHDEALAAGFQVHLAKPVEPAELLSVIANLLGKA